MGSSSECVGQDHEACVTSWCDCGCHHELIDAHHDGAHAEPDWCRQECIKVAAGEPGAATHAEVLDALVTDHARGEHGAPGNYAPKLAGAQAYVAAWSHGRIRVSAPVDYEQAVVEAMASGIRASIGERAPGGVVAIYPCEIYAERDPGARPPSPAWEGPEATSEQVDTIRRAVDEWLTLETDLLRDRVLFGVSFEERTSDGQRRRVDPLAVRILLQKEPG